MGDLQSLLHSINEESKPMDRVSAGFLRLHRNPAMNNFPQNKKMIENTFLYGSTVYRLFLTNLTSFFTCYMTVQIIELFLFFQFNITGLLY